MYLKRYQGYHYLSGVCLSVCLSQTIFLNTLKLNLLKNTEYRALLITGKPKQNLIFNKRETENILADKMCTSSIDLVVTMVAYLSGTLSTRDRLELDRDFH